MRLALRHHNLRYPLEVLPDGEKTLALLQQAEQEGRRTKTLVILLDLNLPKVNGLQLLAAFRASKVFCDTPILVLTSSSSQADESEAFRLGANAFFRKPSDVAQCFTVGKIIKELCAMSN